MKKYFLLFTASFVLCLFLSSCRDDKKENILSTIEGSWKSQHRSTITKKPYGVTFLKDKVVVEDKNFVPEYSYVKGNILVKRTGEDYPVFVIYPKKEKDLIEIENHIWGKGIFQRSTFEELESIRLQPSQRRRNDQPVRFGKNNQPN